MTVGSGLFSNARAVNPSYAAPGKSGLPGEVGDLRRDIALALAPLASIVVEEFTNALAAAANNMMAATASQAAARTLLPGVTPAVGVLTQATITNLQAAPRQIVFTTAGGTAAHQPAQATVVGKGLRGEPLTEVRTLMQTAGAVHTVNFFTDIDSITLTVGQGVGATLAIGLGSKIGLSQPIKTRAGLTTAIKEIAVGSVVTNGTFLAAAAGTAASVTGTVDLVTPVPAMPTTETLVVAIDGGADLTVTFATPADLAAILVAINAVCGAGFATASTNYLMLTSPTTGPTSKIDIKASPVLLAILGLTAAVTEGEGNGQYGSYWPNSAPNGTQDYAIYYESVAA